MKSVFHDDLHELEAMFANIIPIESRHFIAIFNNIMVATKENAAKRRALDWFS